jgi:hypothetical protein
MTHAIRKWALANPAEYGLLFGTPVPGYAAPTDTIGPASRYTIVLIQLIVDMEAAGHTIQPRRCRWRFGATTPSSASASRCPRATRC